MSPYYAASPIVFEDRPCAGQASSGGSQEELQALQEEGIQQASGNKPAGKTPSSAKASEGKPGVLSPDIPATSPAKPEGRSGVAGTSAPTSQKQFVGSVNSSLYHHKDCATANRIKEENKLWFASTEEAEAAGYQPSKCTRDKLGL